MIALTKKETDKLRFLHWAVMEAQETLKKSLNDTALAHGCKIDKERWAVTPDMKKLVKQ